MRPARVAFVAYRGNMKCGGQGVYLWFLVRELAQLGIDVDVFVGPPYPDPMPFARSVHRLPNRQFWAQWFTRDWAAMFPHRDLRARLRQRHRHGSLTLRPAPYDEHSPTFEVARHAHSLLASSSTTIAA